MAANEPVVQREDGHPDNFILKFNRKITTHLVRKGGERHPIVNLRRRCRRESLYQR